MAAARVHHWLAALLLGAGSGGVVGASRSVARRVALNFVAGVLARAALKFSRYIPSKKNK